MLDQALLDPKKNQDFRKIYAKTAPLLLYVAGQLGIQGDEKEDVVQQAYLRLVESRASFTLDHAKAYLTRSVRTIVIDRSRRKKVRKTETVEDWSTLPVRPMWGVDAEHVAAVEAANAYLAGLATKGEAPELVWFYKDGLSVEQIRQRTGAATGTVTAKLTRLRQRHAAPLRAAVDAAVSTLPVRTR